MGQEGQDCRDFQDCRGNQAHREGRARPEGQEGQEDQGDLEPLLGLPDQLGTLGEEPRKLKVAE